MTKLAFLIKTVFFLSFLSFSYGYGSIDPYLPTKISVNNKGLSSIYTFTLKFQTNLAANNYLMINFSNYTTSLSPKSCFYSIYPNFPNNEIICSVPNSNNIIFLQFPIEISSTLNYIFVIELENENPISSLGSGLELRTVSSTDVNTYSTYDYNPNFEPIPYDVSTSHILTTNLYVFDDLQKYNLPNQQVSIHIGVKINIDLSESPRIKLVLTKPWQFRITNIITVSNDPKYIVLSESDNTKSDFKAPLLLNYQIESPLEAYLVFNENLTKGRSFQIDINNFINPGTYSNIFLKVYTMNYNSNSAIEYSISSIQLQTIQNQLKVLLELASKIPLQNNTAGSFYKKSNQYIQINITSSQATPENSFAKIIVGSTNEIIKGSVTIVSGLSPYNASLPINLVYSLNTLTISNLKSVGANTLITLVMRIRTSSVDSIFKVEASFDTVSTVAKPSFYGVSNSYTFQANGYTILSAFTLVMTPTNTFSFTITPSTDDTTINSNLEIFFSRFIRFSGIPICQITAPSASTITDCVLTNQGLYYYMKLSSPVGTNMFPSTGITVSIGGFTLTDCSNHQDKIFEFYFVLNYDNTNTSPRQFMLINSLALPTRNSLTAFEQSISNNLYWTALNYNYPSIINLVGTATAFSAIPLDTGSNLVITVFSYKSFKNLFGNNLVSNSTFPCGSNIGVTCIYIEGDSQSYVTSSYFLDWDRVNIYLPVTIPEDFHIALPDIFLSNTYVYEIYVGKVTPKSEFTYLYLENQLSFTPVALFSTFSANSNLQMQNSGYAAEKVNNFKLNIYSSASHTGNISPNFGAALFIVTDWELWVKGTSSASGTAFGTLQNAVVNFDYIGGDNLHYYIVYIPLINPSHLNAGLVSYLNGVFNPFSLDLPNYVIYLTKSTSEFDTYNAFFNAGPKSYTSNQIKSLSFSCLDLKENEKNTFCYVTFQTNNRIAANGNILLQATGLTFHTDTCSFNYVKGSTLYNVPNFSCKVTNSDFSILDVSLNLNGPLSNANVDYFNISFYGADIDTMGGGLVLLDVSVRDYSNNYIMENLTKSFSVSPKLLKFHVISSINLKYSSPGSATQMNVTVVFPRNIYSNEKIILNLGSDLAEKNRNYGEIQARIINYITKVSYSIYVSFSGSLMTFVFFNQNETIQAGTYIFSMNGIKLPGSTPKTNLVVYFVRKYDESVTISSYDNSTTSFPILVGNDKPNIKLVSSKYLLEGHVNELNFEVTILSSFLDTKTIILLNFPEYYSPSLYSDSSLLYCAINKLQVTCLTDSSFPYQLRLTDFPTFIYAGSTFNITIYGILNPTYANRVLNKYLNSSLIFGVDQFKNGSFSEIAQILPPSVIPLPQTFSYLILVNLYSSNLYAKDFSNYIFQLINKNIVIPIKSGFLINFPSQYSSLNNLEKIKCDASYVNSNGNVINVIDSVSCEVQGKRVKGFFKQSIPQNTVFNITLYNIPNMDVAITINPNYMLISIFNNSEIEILTYTQSNIGTSKPLVFSNKVLDIELNNGKSIILTQGVYFPNIVIKPSDGSRFANNLLLNSTLNGFKFIPNALIVTLGDFFSSFQIGADKDLINGLYSFTFQKQEFGFHNIYSSISPVYMFLTTNPIKITVPEELFVNIYGCNLPFILNITYPPFSGLVLNYMLDYDTFEDTFYVDDELNSYASVFIFNNSITNIAFCTNQNFNLSFSSTFVYLSLTGINSDSYYLSNSQIKINFQNKTRISSPSFSSSINYVGRTEVSIEINSECDGILFWRLVLKEYNTKNLTGDEIRIQLYKNNFSEIRNESNSYDIGIYEISNYILVYNNTSGSSGNNSFTIKGLLPSHEYQFFGYIRNEFKNMSVNSTNLTFLTKGLQNITKIKATYNRTIFLDEINNFYCYIVRKFQTKSKLVVSSASQSCSFYFSASTYYYQYSGLSFSASSNETYLYFIPDAELENDTALEKINQYFDFNSKLVSSDVLNGGKTYGIDFISNLKLITQFNHTILYKAESPFVIPEILNVSFGVFTSKYNSSILVKNLTLSGDGAVYFIMQPYLKTVEDSDFQGDYYNETIQIPSKPSGEQIKNCKTSNNQKAPVCFRGFFYDNKSIDIELRLVETFTVYKVYYMIANENPLFPVFNNSQVYEAEALSYSIYSIKILCWKLVEIAVVIVMIALLNN